MDPSRLAHLRIDALDRLVQAMMKEHLALAAGVESRLAAIEAVLTDEQRPRWSYALRSGWPGSLGSLLLRLSAGRSRDAPPAGRADAYTRRD